jgi:multiple sugar transport system permease protein
VSALSSRGVRGAWRYLAALVVLIVVAFPLYGVVLTSVQNEQDIRSRDVNFIPRYLEFNHYREVLGPGHIVPVKEAMLNSFMVSALAAVIAVSLALPATYALNRLPLPGSRYILAGLASIYLFPTLLFVLPLYVTVVRFGLVDTYAGLVIPYVAFILPFMVWILGAFLKAVPVSVEEAALIDGASRMQVLVRIVLPLMRPGIVAGLLMGFILSWVEFLTPLLFTRELTILTVTLGLYRSTQEIEIGQLAAAAVLTALPLILLTLVFQRIISQVITAGAER